MRPTEALVLTALALPTAGCETIFGAFCGGSLDEFCETHDCAWTWEAALARTQSDTGDWMPIGCEEEAMLVVQGYLMGKTSYYDGATGELQAVVQWSDVNDYCGGTSGSVTWGEEPDCTWACAYDEEDVWESLPLCEEAAAR